MNNVLITRYSSYRLSLDTSSSIQVRTKCGGTLTVVCMWEAESNEYLLLHV